MDAVAITLEPSQLLPDVAAMDAGRYEVVDLDDTTAES